MRRLAGRREAGAAVALALSVIGPQAAAADAPRLAVRCDPVERSGDVAALSCDVRAAGFAVVRDVTARIAGRETQLETAFEAFDPSAKGSTTAYLIQLMPASRRTTFAEMGDAVVAFTDRREGKRRFTAYSFADGLSPIADSGTSRNEFVRQVIAVKPAAASVELYMAALQAIEALAKEPGDRKALVILGDGTSDDGGNEHDRVVKAAREAGIAVHVLGYYDARGERPKFQKLARLAEETGGYAAEVKQGPGKDVAKDIVTDRFVTEVLENGGTARIALKEPPGTRTIVFTAGLSDGGTVTAEAAVEIPASPPVIDVPFTDRGLMSESGATQSGARDGADTGALFLGMLGALIGAGIVGYLVYGRPVPPAGPAVASQAGPLREKGRDPAVYGWLETVDGHAVRHPLQTTSVRVGRHRDNDICLENDSISRRHAVLHYNAETRRFVITDLGGGNGVVVNKTRCKSRELSDGDVVELGEVRLRYWAEHAGAA